MITKGVTLEVETQAPEVTPERRPPLPVGPVVLVRPVVELPAEQAEVVLPGKVLLVQVVWGAARAAALQVAKHRVVLVVPVEQGPEELAAGPHSKFLG